MVVFGLSVTALTHCELAVNLDRSVVDGAIPDGCPICSNPPEGGDEGEEDALPDSPAGDTGDSRDAGPADSSASTDAAGDATPGDGSSEAAPDSGSGD